MSWILIAVVSGSILTGGHDTKEACMGRVATLSDQKITAKCVESPSNWTTSSGSLTVSPYCSNNGMVVPCR